MFYTSYRKICTVIKLYCIKIFIFFSIIDLYSICFRIKEKRKKISQENCKYKPKKSAVYFNVVFFIFAGSLFQGYFKLCCTKFILLYDLSSICDSNLSLTFSYALNLIICSLDIYILFTQFSFKPKFLYKVLFYTYKFYIQLFTTLYTAVIAQTCIH